MSRLSNIKNVFAHFQNLNLLALLENLRQKRTMRSRWTFGAQLCPIAHGLPAGYHVRELSMREQSEDLRQSCEYAARLLGASPKTVLTFVEMWDDEVIASETLLRQLEDVWEERLRDAVAMQDVLRPEPLAAKETEIGAVHGPTKRCT